MNAPTLVKLSLYVEKAGMIISLFSNPALLFMIIKKSNSSFGAYKFIMITYSLFEMMYSAAAFFSKSSFHSTEHGYVLFRPLNGWSKQRAPLFLVSFCSFYFSLLAFLSVHFLYRYFAVCKVTAVWMFQGWNLAFWTLGSFLLGVAGAVLKFHYFGENEYHTELLRSDFIKFYGLKMEDVAYNGPVYQICDSQNCQFPVGTWFTMGVIIGYIITFSGFMITLGALTFTKLRTFRAVQSEKMMRVQKQLWIALLIQTVNPIVFMYLPILVISISPMLGVSLASYANLSMVAFAIYPPLDQLFIIYIIKDYRNFVKRGFWSAVNRMRKQKQSSSTQLETF